MGVLLILFALGLVGITLIIVDGKIFAPIRDWLSESDLTLFGHSLYDLITCPQCTGWWVGVIGWFPLMFYIPVEPCFSMQTILLPFGCLVSGGVVSLLSNFMRSILDWLLMSMPLLLPQDASEGDE